MKKIRYFPGSTITAGIVVASIATCIGVVAYSSISKYGFVGIIRFIWEGDYLPYEVRLAMYELDEIEYSKLPKQQRSLEQLEIEIEVALLNSVDGGSNESISKQVQPSNTLIFPTTTSSQSSNKVYVTGKVKTKIATLSATMDALAASIDSIQTLHSNEVRQRKKFLSNVTVKLMERIDKLISQIHVH